MAEELCRDVEVSTELETAVYLDQFASNNTGVSICFRIFRRLKNENLPTEMRSENTMHDEYTSFVNAYNAYFMTVYQPSAGFSDILAQRTLNELCFTTDDILTTLSKASLGKGLEKKPGDFLRMPTNRLTYHVMKFVQGLAGKSNYPTFQTGSKLCNQTYRPISNLSKLYLVFERFLFNASYPFF